MIVVAQSSNNSRQGTKKCCGVLEKRENTNGRKGFLEKGALEDGKTGMEQHTEEGTPGKEGHMDEGHEVRSGLLCVGTMQSSVRRKGCAGEIRASR